MTDKQKQAIKEVNSALRKLKRVGIQICGMDSDLLYATEKVLKDFPDNSRDTGRDCDYCPVAMANIFSNYGEDTGKLFSDGYQDSGGW